MLDKKTKHSLLNFKVILYLASGMLYSLGFDQDLDSMIK